MANNIKQIKIDNTYYDLVDTGARDLISNLTLNGIKFILSDAAIKTPYGVQTLDSNGDVITGTLKARNSYISGAGLIYLVKSAPIQSDDPYGGEKDVYDEYVVLYKGSNDNPSADTVEANFAWERLGNTEIDFSELGALAKKDNITLNKGTVVNVLGSGTTVTNSDSSVTFTGGTADTFVKSYPGASSKMNTTTITGVSSSTTTASKATAGTAKTVATKAASATTVGNANVGAEVTYGNANVGNAVTYGKANVGEAVSGIFNGATVTDSVLSFNTTSINPAVASTTTLTPAVASTTKIKGAVASTTSIYGCGDNTTITPYTFTDVTVPIKNTDATTVATGTLSGTGGGSTVMTGLGTAVTASAVTNIGTGTAKGQTATVNASNVGVAKHENLSITIS